MKARRLAVLLVAALALVAAGCGGSSDEASSDTDTVAVETTTMDTTTTTEDTATTDDTATDTSSSTDIGALTGKCAELAGLGTKLASAMGGQDAGVENVSKLFDELADEVPDEIKADWQVLAENFGKIAEALKGVDLTSGTPDPETLAKLQALSATLDSQEVQQASAHIEAWVTQNC
jgi:hypothetical protein